MKRSKTRARKTAKKTRRTARKTVDPYIVLRRYFDSVARRIGEGRTRVVYEHPSHSGYVIKVPIDDRGIRNNQYESDTWQDNNGAECRRSEYSHIARQLVGFDVFILVMERVRHLDPSDPMTEDERFFRMCVDCGQIGRSRDGRLVAFDWGPE